MVMITTNLLTSMYMVSKTRFLLGKMVFKNPSCTDSMEYTYFQGFISFISFVAKSTNIFAKIVMNSLMVVKGSFRFQNGWTFGALVGSAGVTVCDMPFQSIFMFESEKSSFITKLYVYMTVTHTKTR